MSYITDFTTQSWSEAINLLQSHIHQHFSKDKHMTQNIDNGTVRGALNVCHSNYFLNPEKWGSKNGCYGNVTQSEKKALLAHFMVLQETRKHESITEPKIFYFIL